MSQITIEHLLLDSAPGQGDDLVAAIDIGSNSFHLVIARVIHNDLQIQTRLKEKVQLISGMQDGMLADDAIGRGLSCLKRFAQCISHIPSKNIRVVATFSLRAAKNANEFCRQAMFIVRRPVEIISGVEEARLIYSGVSNALYEKYQKRLIVDIGGGSTEVTIGQGLEPKLLHSFNCGCVSFKDKFFKRGEINSSNFEHAVTATQMQIMAVESDYLACGWDVCFGSSGTIRAVQDIISYGLEKRQPITRQSLNTLVQEMIACGHESKLKFDHISPVRRGVLAPGVAILYALFETLNIREMNFSQGALREGVLYDILGRSLNQDVRDTTMVNLARRHFADEQQSKRVYASAMAIFDQVAEDWFLAKDEYKRLLGWAAIVHEIGLNVSYAHNNEHAAYILSNSELAGFSHDQKMALASVVRGCRRKFQVALYHDIGSFTAATLRKLSRILRIAIIFNKERVGAGDIDFKVSVAGENMNIELPGDNSTQSTLFGALLEEETKYLQYVGFQLSINE